VSEFARRTSRTDAEAREQRMPGSEQSQQKHKLNRIPHPEGRACHHMSKGGAQEGIMIIHRGRQEWQTHVKVSVAVEFTSGVKLWVSPANDCLCAIVLEKLVARFG